MAYEALAAIGSYIVEAFAGAEAGAGAAAAIGSEAAGAAGATSYSAALATSSAATVSAASQYATYASMAAQALGGAAAVSSSLNQQEAARYNAGMGIANAQQAAMQVGAAEETSRRRSDTVLGEARAGLVQSGVDPSSGTGLLAYEQSSRNAEMDALTIRYQGLLAGRGLLAQSELDTRQATIYGQNAGISGVNAGLSTFGAYQGGKGAYLRQRNTAGAGYYGAGYYGGGY